MLSCISFGERLINPIVSYENSLFSLISRTLRGSTSSGFLRSSFIPDLRSFANLESSSFYTLLSSSLPSNVTARNLQKLRDFISVFSGIIHKEILVLVLRNHTTFLPPWIQNHQNIVTCTNSFIKWISKTRSGFRITVSGVNHMHKKSISLWILFSTLEKQWVVLEWANIEISAS